jgi:hypothetical protein
MGNLFSSVGNAQKQINIPLSWAPFFIVKLLEKDNFMWANFPELINLPVLSARGHYSRMYPLQHSS